MLKSLGAVRFLMIGVFSPTLYRTGGAELVAISMINALKQQGYKVIVSANKKINPKNMRKIYGKNVNIDAQMVFPFHLFPPYNRFNVYTVALQSYALKLKCDILIDAYAFSPFPWADIIYFQGSSLLKRLSTPSMRNAFFIPYSKLLKSIKNSKQRIVLVNSKFTADFLMETFPLEGVIRTLYPPVATKFFNAGGSNFSKPRNDTSITVSRISSEKRLELIPLIAELTNKKISFVIVGSCQSKETLYSILRLTKKLRMTNRVKILTDVSRNHLRTLLWSSKVYLHTMKNEAFGISPIEAMASGCTPVVHDSGGPREYVPEHLRYKSIEEAAEKIERAITDWSPENAKRMLRIANRFDESEFSKKFIEVMSSCVKRKKNRRARSVESSVIKMG